MTRGRKARLCACGCGRELPKGSRRDRLYATGACQVNTFRANTERTISKNGRDTTTVNDDVLALNTKFEVASDTDPGERLFSAKHRSVPNSEAARKRREAEKTARQAARQAERDRRKRLADEQRALKRRAALEASPEVARLRLTRCLFGDAAEEGRAAGAELRRLGLLLEPKCERCGQRRLCDCGRRDCPKRLGCGCFERVWNGATIMTAPCPECGAMPCNCEQQIHHGADCFRARKKSGA